MYTNPVILPHAGSDETFCSLRKAAAARARGARRPSGAEEGVCGELAAPESLARRRTRSVRPEGPRVVVAATLAPLGGEPSWGGAASPTSRNEQQT